MSDVATRNAIKYIQGWMTGFAERLDKIERLIKITKPEALLEIKQNEDVLCPIRSPVKWYAINLFRPPATVPLLVCNKDYTSMGYWSDLRDLWDIPSRKIENITHWAMLPLPYDYDPELHIS